MAEKFPPPLLFLGTVICNINTKGVLYRSLYLLLVPSAEVLLSSPPIEPEQALSTIMLNYLLSSNSLGTFLVCPLFSAPLPEIQ